MNIERKAYLNSLATRTAVLVALIIVIAKFVAWWTTNALSLQASLLDSFLDVGASLLNFFAVKHALRPADAEHRFGHGKAEALASLGQSIFIAASSLWILSEGIQRFFSPETVEANTFSNMVMIISMLLTALLVMLQRYVFKRTHSLAVQADSLHYQTDFLTSAAVLVSLNASSYFNSPLLDSLIGIGIAVYIAITSWEILRKSLDILMDRELDSETIATIKNVCKNHSHVMGIHDLRTRSSGIRQFIQMHVDMNPNLSLLEAHHIALDITQSLKEVFPHAEILIHQDPFGHDDEDFHP